MFSDLTLKSADGKTIPVHKSILAARSPVFEMLFYGDFSESKKSELDLGYPGYLLQERLKIESPDGNGRRYRIAGFCLKFIQQAIISNQAEMLRRIIPIATACFSSLIGASNVVATTTYSIQAFRTLRFTEYYIGPIEPSSSCNSGHRLPTALDLGVLWEDTMIPFAFQYHVENNSHLWDALHGRERHLCPAWSTENRAWLKRKFACINKVTSDFISCSESNSLLELGLLTITGLLRQGDSKEVIAKQTS